MKQMQVFSLNQHLFTTKYGTEHTFDYKMHSSRSHKITTNKCDILETNQVQNAYLAIHPICKSTMARYAVPKILKSMHRNKD